ncbi:putative membrane protein [Pseudomonas coronafaciens pv. oryzae]|uniref:DUF2142 domain-containing protein n=1 Tax=Pseudomonas coronafaciens TaxID=53409 RepID=UPI0006B65AEB|nr:DUF2142 domain-containing protein [Pseudomonas coronafaciens]KPB52626.1 putative membrane protein [Pseudomonas coronafaciens pv. oryzae]KPY06133.1 putative membrane protein [Pseudomonas coronafaciens pv. oryzae]RMT07890.1 putative membrane protein [Pseudomonas coronafaciens pv. oryzae]
MGGLLVRKPWILTLTLIGFISFILSALIPSFMSPDEVDHVKRAYWLSQGKILLDTPPGQSSGGMVDNGLLSYMNTFHLTFMKDRNHKVSSDEFNSASEIRWGGQPTFSPAPGTGYYFPAVYAPQAAGLLIGKTFDLSVESSYRLARLFSLICAIAILIIATIIYESNPLAIALLAVPMTLFQLSSASLDSVSNALAVLAISIFMRISTDREKTRKGLITCLGIVLFVLISSRVHLLPMLVFPFICYFYTRDKRSLIVGTLTTAAVAVWLLIAIKNTVDTRVIVGSPTSTVALYYLSDPIAFLKVLYNTIGNPIIANFYAVAFVGNLGWLDTPLSPAAYERILLLLFFVFIVTALTKDIRKNISARLILIACAGSSFLLVFFAILITFNEHPASVIQGVQGRYFLVPALMFAYSLASSPEKRTNTSRFIGYLFFCVFLSYSTLSTFKLVAKKYYMSDAVPTAMSNTESLSIEKSKLEPSEKLATDKSIAIQLPKSYLSAPTPLKAIKVRLATWQTENVGTAELRMESKDGHIHIEKFSMQSVKDNGYRDFTLDNRDYVKGELRAVSGGGISVWNIRRDDSKVEACIIYEYQNGTAHATDGCPES